MYKMLAPNMCMANNSIAVFLNRCQINCSLTFVHSVMQRCHTAATHNIVNLN